MKINEKITVELAEENPHGCTNMILREMEGKSSKDMIEVTKLYLRQIEIIKELEPVRVIHLRNLILVTKKFEA